MSNKIQKILDSQGFILADGATGTNLFNMGLQAGDPPEFWNISERAKIKKLYSDAVNAGSDLFLTNSFGGNRSRLALHGAQDRAYELSKISAEIGREVADSSDREIIVAGSMGPTGEIMGPAGDLSHELAVEMFQEQAEGLLAGGADVLWVETISAPEEFAAASEAIGNLSADWCGTMSFDTAGRTMMGLTSLGLVELVNNLSHKPVAFGANCGVGASDLLRTMKGMESASYPLIAKGNAGIPKYVDGHIHYDGTPELMAVYAKFAKAMGVKIIGGCCGTLPAHLTAMRAALEDDTPMNSPSLEEISEQLGSFSSESDGLGEAPVSGRARKRRRQKA